MFFVVGNYNHCRIALSNSGAGVKKKCTFYDKLYELFGRRPINIQKGMDSLNATSSVEVNMFDNIPDVDGAIPGCSTFSDEFDNSYINKNGNQFKDTDKSNISSISKNDSIDFIEENSNLTVDKGVDKQQLETSINNEIIDNGNNVAMLLESNRNENSKKKVVFKINKSSNICSSI